MALFTGVQHLCMYLQYSRPSLIYNLFQIFGRRHTPSVRPPVSMFRIDRPITRISSSFMLYRALAVVLSLWRRNRNRMDTYRVNAVNVPESLIVSGARSPWQQQRCDSLHCHEEWWGSVPSYVVVFSWVHKDHDLFAKVKEPVQRKKWTYPCYRVVNTEHQQGWTRWWCTTSSKY